MSRALLLVLAAALALGACGGEAPAGKAAPAASPPLETLVVARESARRERVWDGVIEAVSQATLSAQTGGRVLELPFDVDDYVKAGDVVVRFTDVEQRSASRQAQAQLSAAQAAAREAEAEYTRIADIYQRKLVAKAQLDQATAKRDSARAALEAARAGVSGAGEQVDYTVIKAPFTGIVTARGECEHCIEGRPSLCARGTQANREGRLLTGGPRLRLDGQAVHHHMGLSAFAEYGVVSEKSLVKIPADLSFIEASLFGCAVMCGAGTALYTAGIRPGQSVPVFCLGGVGLSAVLGAVTAGAGRIIAVDPSEEKLALAKSIGASDCVVAGSAGAAEAVREMTQGGVDHAIDTSSSLEGLNHAFEATRRGGSTVTTSLTHPSLKFSFPIARIVAEARTIKGSYIGTCVPGRDIPAFIRLYRQGRMPVDKLVTRTLKLEQINEAFDALSDAKVVRQVITF